MAETLLERIDCTADLGPDRFFSCGATRVVETSTGRYREAEPRPLARFGYRFRIAHAGAPHVLVVRYPDDRRRFMCVQDGTTYDLSTGIVTGFAQPVSGRMATLRQVFWPRWTDCSVVFMTWGHGEPAAAAEIAVYELDDLPPLDVPSAYEGGREIGVQYEDPCGTGAAEGALSRGEWADRVVSYMRHTGQSLLAYPIVWYHGPRYPSEVEPADDFEVVVAPDRRQYSRWTAHPADWVANLCGKLGEADIGFVGVVTLLRLGSLMARMNGDRDAVAKGAETINNVRSDGSVQAGTMDWTPPYNARNLAGLVAAGKSVGVDRDFPYAYGEQVGGPYGPGPMFNPLHPVVHDAIVGLAREIAEKYARFPAFRGIAFNMWTPTILWFGSIQTGYDDHTVGRFARETGISVPGEPGSPDRFARRYAFLAGTCRPAWVAWRCARIRDLVRAIRDAMRAVRPDLRVILDLWSEPFIPAVVGWGEPGNQLGARPATVDLYREAGIDPDLYRDEPGIEIDLQSEGGGRDRTKSMEPDQPIAAFTTFRDHDFLDTRTLSAAAALDRPGAFIFNAWHEAWGNHRWFPVEDGDPNVEKLGDIAGAPAEGVFRLNSIYPADGFWWDSQLRITPAFPPPPHFMEQYAHALAELDALRITRGGLFLDKAHGEEIGRFARAFRALPARKFATVGESTDPVAVRTLHDDGRTWLYCVSREYYPVEVALAYDGLSGPATDLATGQSVPAADMATVTLEPYELRSFRLPATARIAGFSVRVPGEIVAEFARAAADALAAFDAVRTACAFIPGADAMAEDIRAALADGRYARLRRALTSYATRRAFQVSGRTPSYLERYDPHGSA